MSLNSISAVTAHLSRAAFSEDGPGCGTVPHPHPHVGGSPDDGSWCGTPPHPRPHFDLSSLAASLLDKVALNPQPLPPVAEAGAAQLGGGARFSDDEPGCGNGILKLHLPPGPPPSLADAAGALSHVVLNAIGR